MTIPVPILDFLGTVENGIGLEISAWFNHLGGPLLKILLSPFHYLGSGIGYLLLLPSVYWAFDKEFGRRAMFITLGVQYFSIGLKTGLSRPRPLHVAPERFNPIHEYTEPGLPSGHTISGTAVGLTFYKRSVRRGARLAWVLFILLMGISRLVHGVHYPQDVLAGWLIGFLWILAYPKLEQIILKVCRQWDSTRKFLVTGGVSLAAFTLISALSLDYETTKDCLSVSGIIAGALLGIIAEGQAGLFNTENLSPKIRFIRIFFGFLSLAAAYGLLYLAYHVLVGDAQNLWAQILYFIRYAMIGCWTTLGSPWIFTRRVDSRRTQT